MATTLQNLIDACEADLADAANATWSAADIETWCRAAIDDYGLHFPRTLTDAITTSDDVRTYDLQADFLRPVSVEYPTGEDPPEYLTRRVYRNPDFWLYSGCYAIVKRGDDTDVDEIWISEKPEDSEPIPVLYQAPHDSSILTSGNLTVPDRHIFLLRFFVVWQARLQLQITEEKSPTSNSSLLMAQLSSNAQRSRRTYLDALSKAIFVEAESAIVSWRGQVEETTRIY